MTRATRSSSPGGHVPQNAPLTVIDVAHLNLTINLVGLLVLAATLLFLGAYVPAVVLLLFGPYVFPRSGSNVASLGLDRPQRHAARVAAGAGRALAALGAACIQLLPHLDWYPGPGIRVLVREVIAQMTLDRDPCHSRLDGRGDLAERSPRGRPARRCDGNIARVRKPRDLTVSLRDLIYPVEAAGLRGHPRHVTHALSSGLAWSRTNSVFGTTMPWARKQPPSAALMSRILSRDYFRVMWLLYFARWSEDPLRSPAIYFMKLRLILDDGIPDFFPPVWLFLALAMPVHWLANGRAASSGSPSS